MLSAKEYDRNKYNQDFPSAGKLKWVAVQVIAPNDIYNDGRKLTGVLLHDGNFISKSILYFPHEFKVLEKETEEIKELLSFKIS